MPGGIGKASLISDLAEVKIVLKRNAAAGHNAWTGTLETPPYPIYSSSRLQQAFAGQVPMPSQAFPSFRPEPRSSSGPAPAARNDLTSLPATNWHLISQLRLYRPEQVARELEKRRTAPERKSGFEGNLYGLHVCRVGRRHRWRGTRFRYGYKSRTRTATP